MQAKKKGLFYGWYVVIALIMVLGLITVGNGTYNLFFPFYAEEMGLTQFHLGLVGGVCEMLTMVLAIISGILYDKLGVRKMIRIGGVLALINGVLVCFLANSFGILMLFAVLQGIAGMLAGTLTSMVVARNWFIKRAGLASGLVMGMTAVFQGVLYPVLGNLSESIGWRNAWMGYTVVAGVIIIAASFILHNRPSDKGLNPDGVSDEEMALIEKKMAKDAQQQEAMASMTFKEALKSSQFWLICLGTGLLASTATAVVSNITGIAMTVGLEGATATGVMSYYSYSAVFGQILAGALADRFGRIKVLKIACVIEVIIFLCGYFFMDSATSLYVFLVAGGLVFLIPIVSATPILGDMFGLKSLGKISGVQMLICGLISVSGAVISGAIATNTGSYTMYFLIAAFVIALGFIVFSILKPTRVMKANEAFYASLKSGDNN